MSYKNIQSLEDLQKIVDRMTADPDNQWNQIPQNVRDDLLRDVYERIAERSLHKAQKDVEQQEKVNKPKRGRRNPKKVESDEDAQGQRSPTCVSCFQIKMTS